MECNQDMLRIYERIGFRFIERYPECSDPIELTDCFCLFAIRLFPDLALSSLGSERTIGTAAGRVTTLVRLHDATRSIRPSVLSSPAAAQRPKTDHSPPLRGRGKGELILCGQS